MRVLLARPAPVAGQLWISASSGVPIEIIAIALSPAAVGKGKSITWGKDDFILPESMPKGESARFLDGKIITARAAIAKGQKFVLFRYYNAPLEVWGKRRALPVDTRIWGEPYTLFMRAEGDLLDLPQAPARWRWSRLERNPCKQ